MAPVCFSDLPPEALDDIARCAGPLDNVVCSAVCRPWRRALKTTRLRTLEQPSRPYSVRLDQWSNGIELCPLRLTRERIVRIPSDGGAAPVTRIIGSSHGWLVTVDEECGLSLLEAVTGRAFPLPPITSSGSKKVARDLDQMGESMFQKAELVPGRRVGTFAVMLIHGGGNGLSFLRPGAKSWTALWFPKWMQHKYVDVVYHKGAFYTASREAAVTAWAPDASSSGLHATRVTEPRPEKCTWAALVESLGGGDLLMVSSVGAMDDEDHARHGYLRGSRRYEVSRYEEREEGRWLPVEDLGEVAILVGIGGRSLCVSTRGGRDALRNHLYFARPFVSFEYYDGHPREYRLPTATPGCGFDRSMSTSLRRESAGHGAKRDVGVAQMRLTPAARTQTARTTSGVEDAAAG
nr:uncharacterized protein LOC107281124 [Oryza sativa Japonica Group]